MRHFIYEFLWAVVGAGLLMVGSCNPIATSHIEGNVPSPETFSGFLERDLAKYFSDKGIGIASVKYEMLREGATQTGIAYPKFYVWVWVTDKAGALQEGAVRLAAIDRNGFAVTDFFSRSSILSDPTSIEAVFPKPVCEKIREKLT